MSIASTAEISTKHYRAESLSGKIKRKDYNRVFSLIYNELETIAKHQLAKEFRDTTIKSNDLIHELYLKWSSQNSLSFKNKSHLVRLAAKAMRQILIDHARKKLADKRGAGRTRIELVEQQLSREEAKEFMELNTACEELKGINKRLYDIIELKYLCGLSIQQVAETLDISVSTVYRDWKKARTWLFYRLK